MSGPTTTTHDSLVDVFNVKIGRTDPYAAGNASADGLEQKILKAVLGEGVTATSIADFKVLSDLSGNTGTHRVAEISGGDLQVTQHFTHRNAVVLADFLQDASDNTTNATSTATVVINSGTAQTVKSKILNDSSAFENASVKFTVTDPYMVADPLGTFTDASGAFHSTDEVYSGHFAEDANYRYTRNVNANCANTDGTPSISVTEYTAWNTIDYGVVGAGPAFVNGSVTLDASAGTPMATLYGNTVTDNSHNILSNVYKSTGESANGQGFEISYVAGSNEPLVGRYALNWNAGSSGDTSVPITIETNNMTDLVVVANKADYTNFLADTTTAVPLVDLPSELTSSSVIPYLIDASSATLNAGFNFSVTATTGVTGEVLITTTDEFVSPFTIDASDMDFALKNKYYLEQSVDEDGYTLLETKTLSDGVEVTNSLTITNGSLALTGTDAAQFALLDGTESLGGDHYNTDGSIQIYDSAPASTYDQSEDNFPRATGGSEDFASTCVVNYLTSEDGYLADVGVLATADKSIDVSYNITTLVSQTLEDGSAVANKIGRVSGAVAFISTGEGENSAIAASDITFSDNTNTYTDGELTIVDLKCQKKWSDNGIRDNNNELIAGVALDVVASNMSAVGVADIADLRIEAEAKALTGLSSTMRDSFTISGWSLSLAGSDTYLKSSLTNQGVISDANIITILGLSGITVHDLTLNFAPAFTEVDASKFTKFHNTLDITYGGQTQTTYDDEFDYIENNRGLINVVPLTQSDYAGIPAGKTLEKRTYTESISLKTAFRFGNYSNLDLITPTFTQTTTYYVLKDGSRDLPRYFLDGITFTGGAPLKASITSKVGEVVAIPLVAHFVRDDLKPYVAKMLQWKGSEGGVVQNTTADLDVWYNTPTTITQPNVGEFTTNVTLSPSVSNMAMQTFTVDLTLANGVDTFTFTGKKFSAAEVNDLTTKDTAAIDITIATGTALTGSTVYTRGAEGATNGHTLVGGGYTFTMNDNIYVDIRVVACPLGLFKVVKNGGETTYESISDFNGTPYVKLDSGVRVSGGLTTTEHGDSATWTLTNDAILVNHWAAQGVTDYARIPALNHAYRYDDGWKGVKNLIVRGFTPDSTVVIDRTPSSFAFEIAGYIIQSPQGLYTGIQYKGPAIGNLDLSSAADAITMYPASFGDSKVFPLSINYGTYTITDISGTGATAVVTSVPAYKTVISNRKGVRIISKSLSTITGAEYSILYSVSDRLTVHRIDDYTSTSTILSAFTPVTGTSFSMTELKQSTNNLIANVLKIRYLGSGDIPNLTCFFTIAPAFLKFQVVDHSTITSIPFIKVDETQMMTRYRAVNHSAYDGETHAQISQSWNPFSGSDVNNMTISAIARTYEQYRGASNSEVVNFNVGPNNLMIQYATGIYGDNIGDYSTVYEDVIPVDVLDTDDVKFVSSFASTGKLAISLNQSVISNSSMPVIFDGADAEISDKFNLLVELGSHLLSPQDFTLEFNAGDCTGLTTYCIDSMAQNAEYLDVTIAKYTNGSGINSDLFKNNVSNGIAVGGSTKELTTISTLMTGNLTSMLTAIKSAIPASSEWTLIDNGINEDDVLWLKPTSDAGKTALRTALLLNTNIPRSITVFELDDAVRIMDNQGVAVYRVASQGVQYRNTLGGYDAANLATLAHAHLLR